jgi:hypothetical protein
MRTNTNMKIEILEYPERIRALKAMKNGEMARKDRP